MAAIIKNRLTLDPMGKYSNAFYSETTNMSHLGYRTALTDTILKGGHLRIISAKFG
jgi:hypothetical protein